MAVISVDLHVSRAKALVNAGPTVRAGSVRIAQTARHPPGRWLRDRVTSPAQPPRRARASHPAR